MPDLRSADVMRASGTFAIAEGVFLVLGGAMLIIAPFASVVLLTQFTGAFLLLGIIQTGVVVRMSEKVELLKNHLALV